MAEIFLQQRSKATWIRLGDDNTRYFYSVIKHRKLKHATTQLRDKSGNWQTDPAVIATLFVEYYEEILGNETVNRRPATGELIRKGMVLAKEQQCELIKSFEPAEVKKAIF
ncbi:hypothetical protein KY285_016933 [Solanum tuberosum]|nr:hypothetical protein KY284_016931 [Solanum tuberosum]KAH0702655.1 hypothetical protein KY285_016933 [Solanum tuberosum]